ncbi:hypothetical protein SJA_C1-24940 [Sphingobium indicum UT26S]|uniref:Uncharacterized protein n=1 Tax=Sphingobium indicum (strain DSM 16413 / CCM 7287 / MTCC 6362 / UT26 / NBRC 101211 / UT26S) TaxID=452662 RepID=D4Z3Z6_SPHIU|nr:hypothetical protein SJA_C1-24940 [Sphingobium indicum UT26S]
MNVDRGLCGGPLKAVGLGMENVAHPLPPVIRPLVAGLVQQP